ncbi:MAG: hypothetical protein JWN44_5774 [Myxococcales bacterium]|nr:hypothetical protein [Myxococcales bacterium]
MVSVTYSGSKPKAKRTGVLLVLPNTGGFISQDVELLRAAAMCQARSRNGGPPRSGDIGSTIPRDRLFEAWSSDQTRRVWAVSATAHTVRSILESDPTVSFLKMDRPCRAAWLAEPR